jgi:hypothetical protein
MDGWMDGWREGGREGGRERDGVKEGGREGPVLCTPERSWFGQGSPHNSSGSLQSSAYVSIRQHTSASVSIRQHP